MYELRPIWNATHIPKKKKVQLLNVLILTSLEYGLHSSSFTAREYTRLDGLQARLLRWAVHEEPLFMGGDDRRSNEQLRKDYGQPRLSTLIRIRRLALWGRVSRMRRSDPRWWSLWQQPHVPRVHPGKRRPGCPRVQWLENVDADLEEFFGDVTLQTLRHEAQHLLDLWHDRLTRLRCTRAEQGC